MQTYYGKKKNGGQAYAENLQNLSKPGIRQEDFLTRNGQSPKKIWQKILNAARWTPSAHNMQNFEIVVVDDKKLLTAMSGIKQPPNLTFIRENYQQLSFSEEELRRKKVGILGTMFPKSWQTPDPKLEDIRE